jgi:hypothetical protein
VNNTPDGVREVRTVGSDKVSARSVRKVIAGKMTDIISDKKLTISNPAFRARADAAVKAALDPEGDQRVRIPSMGTDEQIDRPLTAADPASASAPRVSDLQVLLREAAEVRQFDPDEMVVSFLRSM